MEEAWARQKIQEQDPLEDRAGALPRLPPWFYMSCIAVLCALARFAFAQPQPLGTSGRPAFVSGSNAHNPSVNSSTFAENLSEGGSEMPFWDVGPWSHCSAGCGTGESNRSVVCVNGDPQDCEKLGPAPRTNQTCTEYSGCQWSAGPWGPCDAECGEGEMHREVLCTNSMIQDCFKILFTVPADKQTCTSVSKCKWHTQDWGPCSNTCGEGMQYRRVSCANGDARFCEEWGDRPAESRTCQSFTGCSRKASGWSNCSETCGVGIRTRGVACVGGNTGECHERSENPPGGGEEQCRDVSGCRWSVGNWSECSSKCGTGKQTRSVTCSNGRPDDCAEAAARPESERGCVETSDCIWTSDWSECTSTCGMGERTRGVSCSNGAPNGCGESPWKATAINESCFNVEGCEWEIGPWGLCSNSCGDGEQTRRVQCSNGLAENCEGQRAAPRARRPCRGNRGCLVAAVVAAGGSQCTAADPVLSLGGVLNALVGWMLAFAGLHELICRACPDSQRSGAGLLSPLAILLAGLAALCSASALQRRIEGGDDVHRAVYTSSLFTIGFVGMVLWAVSFCSRGAPWWGGYTRKALSMWLLSSLTLLVSCGAVLFFALQPEGAETDLQGDAMDRRSLRGGMPT